MSSGAIIGLLALFTIGSTLAGAIFHFGFHLKDPKNLEAAKRVAADRESATSRVSAGNADRKPLRQRLNEAPDINDSLGGREPGLGPLDVLFDSKWSSLRPFLGKIDRRG